MTAKTAKNDAPAPMLVDIDITEEELADAAALLRTRLRQAVLGVKHQSDPGKVSQLGADVRFLMYGARATRQPTAPAPAPRVDDATAKRRAAASDDALMQIQNLAQNKRDRMEAAKEEGVKE